MSIPTEPIGSIPGPPQLLDAIALAGGDHENPALDGLYRDAIRDTIVQLELTGSPVITDGEQKKYHNFWTYCEHGLANTAPDGFKIPFSGGHTRRMPKLTRGPFRYERYADSYLSVAQSYAKVPVKQAVISPSALSLMYPPEEVPGYSRSADVDYAELLPSLFQLKVGNFDIALAGEAEPSRVLAVIREHIRPDQRVFVGVTAPINPRMETVEEVRDRVLQAAQYIPIEQLGTTDDCGFSPFSDDTSTSRATAFENPKASRGDAAQSLGVA